MLDQKTLDEPCPGSGPNLRHEYRALGRHYGRTVFWFYCIHCLKITTEQI